jgi:hypothetical protein
MARMPYFEIVFRFGSVGITDTNCITQNETVQNYFFIVLMPLSNYDGRSIRAIIHGGRNNFSA